MTALPHKSRRHRCRYIDEYEWDGESYQKGYYGEKKEFDLVSKCKCGKRKPDGKAKGAKA